MKTDKKIEDRIEEILDRHLDMFLLAGIPSYQTSEVGIKLMMKELTNLLNTEVQKQVEEAVRGFAEWLYDNKNEYAQLWLKEYLSQQSLDKGDGE